MPMFDLQDAAGVLAEDEGLPQGFSEPLRAPDGVRLDARHGIDRHELHREPAAEEPGFMLERQEVNGRTVRYTTRGYAATSPELERY